VVAYRWMLQRHMCKCCLIMCGIPLAHFLSLLATTTPAFVPFHMSNVKLVYLHSIEPSNCNLQVHGLTRAISSDMARCVISAVGPSADVCAVTTFVQSSRRGCQVDARCAVHEVSHRHGEPLSVCV
jgi:hypothetical protein